MYQAIQTKYIPTTNTRGSRIKATCDRGSITISYPCELDAESAHIAAADMLCKKFEREDLKRYGPNAKSTWAGLRITGGLKDGTCAHVFIPRKT